MFGMALCLQLAGCLDFGLGSDTASNSSGTDFGVYVPDTSLLVDPASFMGDVACTNNGGGLRSYVATVYDITSNGPAVVLASSSAVPCSRNTVFEFISPSHFYVLEVDGYEEVADRLVPLLGKGSGSRAMVKANADGSPGSDVVMPRWKADCDVVKAQERGRVVFGTCNTFRDMGTSPSTSIVVEPWTALGENMCVGDGGEVAEFEVDPEDAGLPSAVGLSCPGQPVVYNGGISEGQTYGFVVKGYRHKAGATLPELELHWKSLCYAQPKAGQVTLAVCDPLDDKGRIEMKPSLLMGASKYACGQAVAYYTASVEKEGISSGPVDCSKAVVLGSFVPGSYEVRLTLYGDGGVLQYDTICLAEVGIGETVGVVCPAIP